MKVLKFDVKLIGPRGASRTFAFPFPYDADLERAVAEGKVSGYVSGIAARDDMGCPPFANEPEVHEAIKGLLAEPEALKALKSAFKGTSAPGKRKPAKKKKASPRRSKISR